MQPSILIAIIAQTAIGLYTSMNQNSSNAPMVAKLIAAAGQIYNSLQTVQAALQQAQAEQWPEGDRRYLPLFAAAHQAIEAAEASL